MRRLGAAGARGPSLAAVGKLLCDSADIGITAWQRQAQIEPSLHAAWQLKAMSATHAAHLRSQRSLKSAPPSTLVGPPLAYTPCMPTSKLVLCNICLQLPRGANRLESPAGLFAGIHEQRSSSITHREGTFIIVELDLQQEQREVGPCSVQWAAQRHGGKEGMNRRSQPGWHWSEVPQLQSTWT